MLIEKRVALVTAGGGYGIGRSACLQLAKNGAFVAVTDRSGKRAAAVAAEIRSAGGRADSWELDVTDPTGVETVFAEVASRLGPIEILVNNAGVSIPCPVSEMTNEAFDKVVGVSLYGTFYCARTAIRGMMERRFGRIVNISSYVAFAGSPDLAHYGAAKAGIVGFTKSLALEVGRFNITVNAIAPGIILNEHLRANRSQFSPEIQERLEKGTPLGRHGEPDDIAAAVLFFAATPDSFVTGTTLPVSGGLYMI
jgi:NAD(P)-dependent dehydrogenase (short-subunit alcohol dehydrogenase family)